MACLIVTEGPHAGIHFPLGDQKLVSVGRDEDCTIQIPDPKVSRRHLQIRFEPAEGRHYAADYRSANGVRMNGGPMMQDTALKDGDVIQIGATTIVYSTADFADAATALKAMRVKDQWKRSTMIER